MVAVGLPSAVYPHAEKIGTLIANWQEQRSGSCTGEGGNRPLAVDMVRWR